MLANPGARMSGGFTNIARITASTRKFVYHLRMQRIGDQNLHTHKVLFLPCKKYRLTWCLIPYNISLVGNNVDFTLY